LNFFEKNALIIGGTGGIGRETAVLLGENGAHITLTGGSSQERLDKTLDAARSRGASADGFLCALNSAEDIAPLFSAYRSRFSRLPDILVYAYGPFKRMGISETTPEDWLFLAQNNLVMPGIAVSLALASMFERKWGRILLFGGTNTDTIRGFLSTSAYSSAKTALGTLAKSAAKTAASLGMDDVTCNVICPGLVDTEYLSTAERAYNRGKNAGGKPLTAQSIAETALRVLENPTINGAVISADRGMFL
jgi:NAD(P)-dependent dehydrogenase (short-subunit alcohol dehydrogenase family)